MFCKDCGAQLSDDARFCPHCGSAQTVTPPAEAEEPAQSFADKVRATGKKLGFSTAFLIATICLTLVQVLGLFAFTPTDGISNVYQGIIPEFSTHPALDGMSPVMNFINALPGILIVLGLWITFFSCASRKNKANTSGLTMIFVVCLVQMVTTCLTLLTSLIPVAAIYAGEYKLLLDEDFIEAIALTAGIVLLVVFVFALIYYIKLCATISNIRSTLKTGVPSKKVSRFVAIMCYIGGGFFILGGIFTLLSAGVMTLDGYYDGAVTYSLHPVIFLSAVTSLLTATAQIIFGALIFTYRRKMAALEEEDRLTTFQTLSHAEPYTAPVYIPPEPVTEPEAAEPATEEFDETKRWDL